MNEQDFEAHVLRIKLEGYTVLPNQLTDEECKEAKLHLERLANEADSYSIGGINNLKKKKKKEKRNRE
jgi:hypothetical protein